MDLSPKLLTDVQFREQWRGYNPDEVDEFLERVAAGIEELQGRLNEALERASNAEHRLLERSDEDEIRRTLVLAQRTAVASMEEARAEADRLVSETEARCRTLVADAEAQSARLDADIATRRRLELGDLAEQRAALQQDIDHLHAFLDDERTRLGDVLRGQLEWLESSYALADLPSLSGIAAPEPIAPVAMRAAATIEAAPIESMSEPEPELSTFDDLVIEADDDDPLAPLDADDLEPEPAPEPVASAVDDLRLAREELADALRRAGVETEDERVERAEPISSGRPAEGDAPLQVAPQLPRPAPHDDGVGEPTGAFDVLADEPVATAEEEADEPRWRDEDDDDPFLAELRRAVVDTEPLGPRDADHEQAPGGYDDDDLSAGGFFRRGRRRG